MNGKILYICDKQACENCSFPECYHTTDINHAYNFVKEELGNYVEKFFVKEEEE